MKKLTEFSLKRKSVLFSCIAFLSFFLATAQGDPSITSVSPNCGPPGTIVTIYGKNFYEFEDPDVFFYYDDATKAKAAKILSYDDSAIKVVVPEGISEGNITIISQKHLLPIAVSPDYYYPECRKNFVSLQWQLFDQIRKLYY